MNFKKNVLKLTVAAVSIVSASALAEGYVGFGAGQAMFGDVELSNSVASASRPIDQNAFAARVYAGYNFNDYIGAEVVAGNIGSVSMDLDGNDKATIDSIKYFSVQPKIMFPFYEKFNLFAKAGVGYSFVEATGTGDGGSMSVTANTLSTAFGLGAEYLITDNLSARINWEYTKPVFDMSNLAGGELDVSLNIQQVYAGINYRF